MPIVRRKPLAAPTALTTRRPALHDMIGRRLRLHYAETQRHPLPARLKALLEQLAEDPAPSRRN